MGIASGGVISHNEYIIGGFYMGGDMGKNHVYYKIVPFI